MQETDQQPEGGADVLSSVWLECEDCHCKGADVEKTTCPYTEEILNKVVPATLCKKCYHERAMYICWVRDTLVSGPPDIWSLRLMQFA